MSAPKYIKIRNMILDDIRSGKLKPGEQLPTREEMLTQYSVTRTTIEKAISDLNHRKILKSITKRGTFVTGESVAIKTAVVYDMNLIASIEARLNMNELGLLYYSMMINSKGIEYQFLDLRTVLANPRLLAEFDVAVWVQPSTKILSQIEGLDVQSVVINRKIPQYNCISTDHKASAFEVTDYYINKLKSKSPQLFFIYSSKSIKIVGKARLEGFIEACAKHQAFYRILDLEGGHFSVTRDLLNLNINFDSPAFILSGSEKYTGAILKLAKEKQINFGKELFYCDYDNQQSLDKTGVEFTSIVQDYFEMGRLLSLHLPKIGKEPIHIDVPYLITGLNS